jgi:valyl-tRNA synthetase
MAGLIDKEAEQTRLEKEIGKIRKDMDRIEAKLGNPNFVEKAPEAVVLKERSKLEDQQSALAKLAEQLERICSL